MKRLFCIFFFIAMIPTLSLIAGRKLTLADKNATAETVKLYSSMNKLTDKGIMFGHQDDLAYGIGWKAPNGQSDVFRMVNDYPAVFGWDLGHIETGSACNLDSVPFTDMKKYAILVHARGGINEFSWHCNNPLTEGSAWDVTNPEVVRSILPAGKLNHVYIQWLDEVANFLEGLRDETGKPIPVLFRPFHEQGGSWFWWGKSLCSVAEFKELWQYTVNYLNHTKNLHNLIFVFSNSDSFNNSEEFLERYPGNDWVDIIGFDLYQDPKTSNETFASLLKNKLTILVNAADKLNKLPAITEIGFEQIPYPTWWTEVLWPSIHRFRLSYTLFWRNAANRPNHYYMPYPGQISEKDFLDLYHLPCTLFGKDLEKESIYR